MATLRETGWVHFDAIVAGVARRDVNPRAGSGARAAYAPDYDSLELLLGVPVLLKATSQSGVPALALDVCVANEFRRSGFDPDRVWPRPAVPRVLPGEIVDFVGKLPAKERAALRQRIERGVGGYGAANLLGRTTSSRSMS